MTAPRQSVSENSFGLAPGDDSESAVQRHRTTSRSRARIFVDVAIWFLFASLLLDGFPPGADALREFGARPANFLLIVALIALVVRRRMRGYAPSIGLKDSYVLLVVLFCVPLINLPVTIFQAGGAATAVLIDWTKQYLMFLWGITSYYLWKAIVGRIGRDRYCALQCLGAVLPVVFFFLEYFDASGTTRDVLNLFRFKRDLRPSSFATEPSIYAAWIAFVWPIVFYSARSLRGGRVRIGAWLLLVMMVASGYLSHARTFAVILMLQLIYVGYWVVQRRQAWGKRVRSLLFTLCITSVAVLILVGRLATLVDVSDNKSNLARLAYTVTGIRVAIAHPLVGVGIGQFGNFFARYVPEFALAIREVRQHAFGMSQFRASTFNLFVRFACEFGFPIGILLSALVVSPVIRAPRAATKDPFLLFAALSAVGGIGFWLSQDPYGYQPGILALAVVSLMISQAGTGERLCSSAV